MTPKAAKLAIMFADVSGSTQLYEKLGDKHAQRLISAVLRAISGIIRNHEGKIIKTIGDEVMCIFTGVEKAVNTATQVHRKFHDPSATYEFLPLQMRIGIHYGPALIEQGDVYGDTVNMAARMAAQAKARQTVLTEDTLKMLPRDLRGSCRMLDRIIVKGKKELTSIYEVLWQSEDATCLAPKTRVRQTGSTRNLQVTYQDQNLTLNRSCHTLVLGRSKDCDMPVDEELASRYHVRLEMRRDKFFIIDQSTNGTHVRSNGQLSYLHREEGLLSDSGEISMGRPFSDNPPALVRFSGKRGA